MLTLQLQTLLFQDVAILPYLKHSDDFNFDIKLEVQLKGTSLIVNSTVVWAYR